MCGVGEEELHIRAALADGQKTGAKGNKHGEEPRLQQNHSRVEALRIRGATNNHQRATHALVVLDRPVQLEGVSSVRPRLSLQEGG